MRHAPIIAIAILGCITGIVTWQPNAEPHAVATVTKSKTEFDPSTVRLASYTLANIERHASWMQEATEEQTETQPPEVRLSEIEERLYDLYDYSGNDVRYESEELEKIEDDLAELLNDHPDLEVKYKRKIRRIRQHIASMRTLPSRTRPIPVPDRSQPASEESAFLSEPTPYLESPAPRQPSPQSIARPQSGGQRTSFFSSPSLPTPQTQALYGGQQLGPATYAAQSAVGYQANVAAVVTYRPALPSGTTPALSTPLGVQEQRVYEEGRTLYRLQRVPTDGFDFLGLRSLYWIPYKEPGRYVRKVVYQLPGSLGS